MKKAGLCVRYDCDNFGSMLQIYATQKAINDAGWDYEIIRYDKRTPLFYIQNISRIFNPFFMKGKIATFEKNQTLKKYPEAYQGDNTRRKCFAEYRKKYIGPYSEFYRGYENLAAGAENYDAVIVGSDQLWTPAGIKSKFYNLLFVPDHIKKISFATSFGVSHVPDNQKKMTAEYLRRIDYISVRETRGAEIVKELTGRDAVVALDPTLLFTGDEWKSIFPEEKIIDGPYIFAYFLGENPEHREAVNQLRESTGLKVVTVPFMDQFVKNDLEFGDEALYHVGPVDFLNLIRGAEYICTDSFHGSVFSILSHKAFITFNRTQSDDKASRNSRIDSLFDLLKIDGHRYLHEMKIEESIQNDIDYYSVDQLLIDLRNDSRIFIKNSLDADI